MSLHPLFFLLPYHVLIILAILPIGFIAIFIFRKRIPILVNCWFCNKNQWIVNAERNSWICRKCEQYNGFNREGDYNIRLDTQTPKVNRYIRNRYSFPNTNGLCKKCNLNQQLKIMQLASFVPLNERNFDVEVDTFKSHLEKVHRLCSSCRHFLKLKLSTEKKVHLNTKLLNNRNHCKKLDTKSNITHKFKLFLNLFLKIIIVSLLCIILIDILVNFHLFFSKSMIYYTKKHFVDMYSDATRLFYEEQPIVKQCLNSEFMILIFNTSLHSYNRIKDFIPDVMSVPEYTVPDVMSLETLIYVLCVFGSITHSVLCVFNFKKTSNIFIFAVWAFIIYTAKLGTKHLHGLQVCLLLVVIWDFYRNEAVGQEKVKERIKKLNQENSKIDDKYSSDESDSDSHPSPKFHMQSPINFKKIDHFGNPFYDMSYPKFPQTNQTNNLKPPSSCNLDWKDYDLELNQSISDLNISQNSKYNSSPISHARVVNLNSDACLLLHPMYRNKLILPSRFIHGTQQSWVAGGYWSAENPNSFYNIRKTSSSSSQSSGFESFTSSVHHRNVNSATHSREESVCSEYEKKIDYVNNYLFNEPYVRSHCRYVPPNWK